jgi:Ca2+-binding RTX toxin-like protein
LITDSDDSYMSSAKVVLTNEHAGDYLAINGTQLHDGSAGTINGIGYTVSDTGSAITVNLTGSDSIADYQSVINAITYGSNSQDPSEASRTVEVTVTDAHGNVSNTADATITVLAVNDAPTLTVDSNHATFTEGNGVGVQGAAVFVFKNAAADTVENGQTIKEVDFTVSGLKDGANETIKVDGTTISLGGNSSGTTATDGMNYAVTVSGGVATVSLTLAAGISEAAAQALINGIQYLNTNVDNPTDGNRTFTLTSISDNGGTDNGGHDTTSLSASATVNVNPIDDPTVFTNGLHVISNNGSSAFSISDAAFLNYVSDPDGSLTITDANNDSGLTATHSSSNSSITIDDNSTAGGTFTFVVSDGTPPSATSGTVTYQQDTDDLTLNGTSGNDIIVAAANSTVQHTTIGFNANGYDAGDKVSLTINGTTYGYTVDSSHMSAESVYDGLKALVGSALSSDGVTWASNLDANHSVLLTGDPGETFTVTSGITNAAAQPWITTVDFNNSVNNFSSGSTEHISITVNGVTYTEGYTGGTSDGTRFDNAAGHLVDTLNDVSGITATYNTSQNTFTITTTFDPHTVTGSSTSNDTSGSVSTLQTGNSPADQAAPLTTTTYDNLTINGNGGDDYLIGSNGSDTLYGGSGHDVMIGGGGADHFLYKALSDGGTLASGDHILDFSGSAGGQGDVIDLLASVFGSGSGAIANADLIQVADGKDLTAASGPNAVDMGSSHFAYQQSTGQLFYDSDGGSAANRVLVAVFDNHATVQATDIHKV